jgi:hypothetical protein
MQNQKDFGLIRKFLEHKHLPLVLAVVAFITMLPSLKQEWEPMDDLRYRAKLLEPGQIPERLHDTGLVPENSGKLSTALLYLHDGTCAGDGLKKLMDYGTCPWWTYEELRFSHFRPLDSFTHWLDYRLYPNSAAMMRTHNLVWFSTVIFLVAVLYRRLIPCMWAAGLAAVFYFLNNSNYLPATWIANRNLLLSLVFATAAVLFHHRWRTTNRPSAAVFSVLFLLASLLSTEAGIATFAFLFSYALFLDRSRWLKRGLSLAPAVLIIVIWRLVYNAMGYGAYGGGFIIDPYREPLRYIWVVCERGPILLTAQLTGAPSELFSFYHSSIKIKIWLGVVIFLVAVVVILLPLLRKDHLARFWFTAMVLCVVPICATMPMNRNLLFVSIAAFGLIAQFIRFMFAKESWPPNHRRLQKAAWGLCVVFLILHLPAAATARVLLPNSIESFRDKFKATMDLGYLKGIENQELVIVNTPNPFTCFFIPTFRVHNNQPLPKSIRVLAPAFAKLEVIRTDDKSLLVKSNDHNIFSCPKKSRLDSAYLFESFSTGFRDNRFPLRVGQKVVLPRFTAEVIGVDKRGLPTEILFTFAISLDDPTLCWVKWDKEKAAFVPFTVPAVGERTVAAGLFNH